MRFSHRVSVLLRAFRLVLLRHIRCGLSGSHFEHSFAIHWSSADSECSRYLQRRYLVVRGCARARPAINQRFRISINRENESFEDWDDKPLSSSQHVSNGCARNVGMPAETIVVSFSSRYGTVREKGLLSSAFVFCRRNRWTLDAFGDERPSAAGLPQP